uniref:USP domain-containing protein n=1 Tax=Lactuca sativa TaxID=4236 RepID=A0A9R1XQW1_LACSA|nr:hypothetical protein LSAT_V11C200075840 [Lactuca sativa]
MFSYILFLNHNFQGLYFCVPFREQLLKYYEKVKNPDVEENLLTCLAELFTQGILTNETKCLRCEIVTARDETLLDLSLDNEQNRSITSCLKNFSSTETLNAEDKFFCDKCCSLQEAQKRMKIKKQPHILVIHLKRFKCMEQLGRYKKLSYRVVFPLDLIACCYMFEYQCGPT